MKRITCASLAVFFVFVTTLTIFAGRISLSVDPSLRTTSNSVETTVIVRNNGDEEAHQVSVEAMLGEKSVRSSAVGTLDPGARHEFQLDLGEMQSTNGVVPVVILTEYLDMRGYPSSSLRTIPLNSLSTTNVAGTIDVRVSGATVRDVTEVTVTLSVSTGSTGPVPLELLLPNEFSCVDDSRMVNIPESGKAVATFHVTNRYALPGSAYRIFAVARWTDGTSELCSIGKGRLRVQSYTNFLCHNEIVCMVAGCLFIMAFICIQFRKRDKNGGEGETAQPKRSMAIATFLCSVVLLWFIFDHIPPTLLLQDTVTTGGDTIAHNYLASHLQSSIGTQGRVVSWAQGWWCGFPMFQYYFSLPYLIMVLLNCVMPFNIAFKVVTILGTVLLPVSAYTLARSLKLPRPGPLFMAIATIPILFDHSNTMWGVNIYSTLAGMIANSISFPIMLFAIGSVAVDCDRGKFSYRSVCLLVALLASHFFTSIMAALCIAIIPLTRPSAGFRKAIKVLLQEGILALLLMSWWIVPLLAKRHFSVDFGTNWDVDLLTNLPSFLAWVLPMGAVGLIASPWKGGGRFMLVTAWMLISSGFLFFMGYNYISPVFVNVRLWPFMVYALTAISFGGAGIIASNRRGVTLALAGLFLLTASLGIEQSRDVRSWAEWNYAGLEKKPGWQVFEDLVLPLDGTPGRLANDLHDHNNSLGSSRVFECVPHLIDKPILEGGIVNSAAGSLFSYYVQGETSRNCAGFPPIVEPATFNITNATEHLELFNVKHFIARWKNTREALAASPKWSRLGESRGWELYELTSHDGSYIVVSEVEPIAVRTRQWKEAALDWIYRREMIDQPFVFLDPADDDPRFSETLNEETYAAMVNSGTATNETQGAVSWRTNSTPIVSQQFEEERILFETTAIGLPHIIKCTYFPNWKVRGADKVYMVSPCFMLVYPTESKVELYYGYTLSDNAGRILTLVGILCALAGVWHKLSSGRRRRKEAWHVA